MSQIEVGPQIALSRLNLELATGKLGNYLQLDESWNFLKILLPSDRLPSVLMELLGFVQLGVLVGEGHQDQDRHQASVQRRGEN